MDDLFTLIVGFLILLVIGWVLGIAGFVRSGRALAEVARLRAKLAARPAAPPQPLPAAIVPLVEPVPEPMPEPELAPEPDLLPEVPASVPIAVPARPRRDWEELLAARWGVWLGAAALLLAAVFLVRYAAEQDLLGPGVRCLAALAGGVALVAGAEWLQRRSTGPARLPDYAPGALAAGGVAAWFAAGYMAGVVYDLIPLLATFGLLAASSLAGLLLSLRYGPLVASVGVVGAFATPFLSGGTGADNDFPLMYVYFLFVAASALAVVRYTAWAWLGWATTVACAGLVMVAVLAAPWYSADVLWLPALFAPASACLFLFFLPPAALDTVYGRRLSYIALAALGATAVLLAATMPVPATRVAVIGLAAVALGRGGTEARLDWLPAGGALLFLLLLAAWGLPPWQPTGDEVRTEGIVIAVLPGDWTPAVLRPLLLTAAAGAVVFFAAGLWGERRRPHPLRWSTLAASVPVLALVLLFWRVAGFQSGVSWAACAAGIAAASTAAAARAATSERAGAHAAGATAALALGCGALLSAEWLTLSLALFVPALALIERSTGLEPLRRVALAMATVVGVRLLLNEAVLEDVDGQPVLWNALLPVYAVSAAAFAAGAVVFGRRRDDLAVAVLRLGSAAFVAALVVLEIRQWATSGHPATVETSFLEVASDVSALSLLTLFAFHLRARAAVDTPSRIAMGWAAGVGTAVSLLCGAGLILLNPAVLAPGSTGPGVLLNPLPLAYLVPAAAALLALRRPDVPRRLRPVLGTYALVALFAYVSLQVRQAFHPGTMSEDGVTNAELWALSGAWLLFGIALMAAGIAARSRPVRLAALAVVALAAAKVFLFDLSGLDGLWRALSFGGLGLVLIGLGAAYRRFVAPPDAPAPTDASTTS